MTITTNRLTFIAATAIVAVYSLALFAQVAMHIAA
jgi:hypothetical protein